jgi:hypothetical protein
LFISFLFGILRYSAVSCAGAGHWAGFVTGCMEYTGDTENPVADADDSG